MFSSKQMLILVSILAVACGGVDKSKQSETSTFVVVRPKLATAILLPTEDGLVTGIVDFTSRDEKIIVDAEFQGLEPGLYGFRIHEVGDCSQPYAQSAGGYFNPGNAERDGPVNSNINTSNYENIEADEYGAILVKFVDESLTLEGPYSIINRSVIIHLRTNDMSSQTFENPCHRLACGVITLY